mmetsp:Transcript_31925/g.41069  ORF Transcript_31925/g.41069 Transcript_31925/m.41069 type:complete len:208 (+) Transcript_31925:12-635(+)
MALLAIHIEDLNEDFLRCRDDFAWVYVLLGPAHFRDVDQAFNTVFELNKRTVIGDVCDLTRHTRADCVLALDIVPRIAFELLHTKADALGLWVDLDDLNFDRVANIDDLAWVIDALPAHVSDVQEAINAAKINERTVIGDVLDDAFAGIAFVHIANDFRALLGTALFEDGTARDNNVAARAVHFQNCEWLNFVHQWANIANWADVDL